MRHASSVQPQRGAGTQQGTVHARRIGPPGLLCALRYLLLCPSASERDSEIGARLSTRRLDLSRDLPGAGDAVIRNRSAELDIPPAHLIKHPKSLPGPPGLADSDTGRPDHGLDPGPQTHSRKRDMGMERT